MKKVYLTAIIVFGFAAIAKAGDMEVLKGAGFGNLGIDKMTEMEIAPAPVSQKESVKEADGIEVGQGLIDKFTRVKNTLRRLRHNTTWLDSDMDRLERDARRIAGSGRPDPFFENSLRRFSSTTSGYADDASRIYMDIKNLLNIAVKSDELNKISGSMELDARDIYNDAQFRLESAAMSLERTVRSVNPRLIGHNAHWTASDITSNVRRYSWKVRDIRSGARNLTRETQP